VTKLLQEIAACKVVTLEVPYDPSKIIRKFITSNGWQIFIFDDAGEMDYIERAIAPNKAKGSFEDWRENPLKEVPMGLVIALEWEEGSFYKPWYTK
jgi:hypothetical protein